MFKNDRVCLLEASKMGQKTLAFLTVRIKMELQCLGSNREGFVLFAELTNVFFSDHTRYMLDTFQENR